MIKFFISLCVLLLSSCHQVGFAQTIPNEALNPNDPNYNSELNDLIHQISNSISTTNSKANVASNITGIVSSTHGGTSSDFHTCAQGTVPYFSATGIMSCLAVGISGQVLTTQGASANPIWSTPTVVPTVTAYANNVVATCAADNNACSVSSNISNTGDWTGKHYEFVGNISWNTTGATASSVAWKNTSTTAWSGLQGNATSTSFGTGSGSVVLDDSNATFLNGVNCNVGSTCSCGFVISSGNLILQITRTGGGSSAAANSCAVKGIIVREP